MLYKNLKVAFATFLFAKISISMLQSIYIHQLIVSYFGSNYVRYMQHYLQKDKVLTI